MKKDSRPSAGLLATGIFCVTVLVGIGGTSAYALWEQSSTATMTVRAATSAPTPTPSPTPTPTPTPSPTPTPTPGNQPSSLTLLCTNRGSVAVDLGIVGTGTPVSMSIAAKVVGGTYGVSLPLAASATNVHLTPISPVILTAGVANRNVVIKVTATSANGTVSVAEYDHLKITGAGTKIDCR